MSFDSKIEYFHSLDSETQQTQSTLYKCWGSTLTRTYKIMSFVAQNKPI